MAYEARNFLFLKK